MPEMQQYYLTATTDDVLDDIIPMTGNDMYPGAFPGYVGMSADNLTVDGFIPTCFAATDGTDAAGRNVDYDSHGESGEVNRNSYSIGGPVEPNLVEDFQLYGDVLGSQRRPEYGTGPVAQYDHNAYTALQIAQQMSPEAYADEAIALLVTGA